MSKRVRHRLSLTPSLRPRPGAGKWEFTLQEAADGRSVQLDVAFGKYLDSSAIQAGGVPNAKCSSKCCCRGVGWEASGDGMGPSSS